MLHCTVHLLVWIVATVVVLETAYGGYSIYPPLPESSDIEKYTLVLRKETIPGFSLPRITINGTTPGPVLNVTLGNKVEITVINHLEDDGTAVHWHGMTVKNFPWSDGLVNITQCPIPQNNKLVYTFQPDSSGTYWYHGHYHGQQLDGLYGPLIVRHPEENKIFADNDAPYDIDTPTWTFTIVDYYAEKPEILVKNFLHEASGIDPIPDAFLVNNHYANTWNITGIKKNETIRMRVINGAAVSAFNISIDGMSLTIIELDGVPIQPITTDIISLQSAQRVSFIVNWTKNLLLQSPYSSPSLYLRIVLDSRFYLQSTGANSSTTLISTVLQQPLNTLWRGLIVFDHHHTTTSSSSSSSLLLPTYNDTDIARYQHLIPNDLNFLEAKPLYRNMAPVPDYYLNITTDFQYNAQGMLMGKINGASMMDKDGMLMTSGEEPVLFSYLKLTPNDSLPAYPFPQPPKYLLGDGINPFIIPANKVIEMHIFGYCCGVHPFHIHGHHFWIVQSSDQPDIAAGQHDDGTNGLYIVRDVVNVPAGGWVKIRFLSDNPGIWLFHCHLFWHMEMGLGAFLMEGMDQMVENIHSGKWELPPTARQICTNHENNHDINKGRYNGSSHATNTTKLPSHPPTMIPTSHPSYRVTTTPTTTTTTTPTITPATTPTTILTTTPTTTIIPTTTPTTTTTTTTTPTTAPTTTTTPTATPTITTTATPTTTPRRRRMSLPPFFLTTTMMMNTEPKIVPKEAPPPLIPPPPPLLPLKPEPPLIPTLYPVLMPTEYPMPVTVTEMPSNSGNTTTTFLPTMSKPSNETFYPTTNTISNMSYVPTTLMPSAMNTTPNHTLSPTILYDIFPSTTPSTISLTTPFPTTAMTGNTTQSPPSPSNPSSSALLQYTIFVNMVTDPFVEHQLNATTIQSKIMYAIGESFQSSFTVFLWLEHMRLSCTRIHQKWRGGPNSSSGSMIPCNDSLVMIRMVDALNMYDAKFLQSMNRTDSTHTTDIGTLILSIQQYVDTHLAAITESVLTALDINTTESMQIVKILVSDYHSLPNHIIFPTATPTTTTTLVPTTEPTLQSISTPIQDNVSIIIATSHGTAGEEFAAFFNTNLITACLIVVMGGLFVCCCLIPLLCFYMLGPKQSRVVTNSDSSIVSSTANNTTSAYQPTVRFTLPDDGGAGSRTRTMSAPNMNASTPELERYDSFMTCRAAELEVDDWNIPQVEEIVEGRSRSNSIPGAHSHPPHFLEEISPLPLPIRQPLYRIYPTADESRKNGRSTKSNEHPNIRQY